MCLNNKLNSIIIPISFLLLSLIYNEIINGEKIIVSMFSCWLVSREKIEAMEIDNLDKFDRLQNGNLHGQRFLCVCIKIQTGAFC